MSTGKKVIIGLLMVIVASGTYLCVRHHQEHSGKTYYLKLVNPGKRTGDHDTKDSIEYEYKEAAFNKNGKQIDVDFFSFRERALRKNAYLSIVYNKKNGVISYEEVQPEHIPVKAKKGIDDNARTISR